MKALGHAVSPTNLVETAGRGSSAGSVSEPKSGKSHLLDFALSPVPKIEPHVKGNPFGIGKLPKPNIETKDSKRRAREYLDIEEPKVYDEHVEQDADGKPVVETKTVKEPVPKAPMSQIQKAYKHLEADLKDINDKAERSRRESRFFFRHFKVGPHGQLKTKTVKVKQPVFKTSRKAYERDLHRVHQTARAIRLNNIHWEPPHKGPHSVGDQLLGLVGNAVQAQDELSPLSDVKHTATQSANHLLHWRNPALQSAGFVPADGGSLLAKAGEYLQRPADATRTALAKGAVKAGLIHGETAERIKHAKGPGQAFLHGSRGGNLVSGGQLSQGLFGTPTLGLPIDILTDPTTYVGAGAIRAGTKAATRSAQIANRLKDADVAVDADRLDSVLSEARRTGNFSEAEQELRKLAKDHDVRLAGLGKTRADRRAAKDIKREAKGPTQAQRDLLAHAKRQRENAGEFGSGDAAYVPGREAIEAVKDTAAWVQRNRVEPGFELRLLTPFGRRVAGVPVRLPEGIPTFRGGSWQINHSGRIKDAHAEKPWKLGARLHAMRYDKAAERVRATYAEPYNEALDEWERLKSNPTATREQVLAAEQHVDDLDEEINEAIRAERAGTSHAHGATLGERIDLRNRRELAHRVNEAATNVDRDIKQQYLHRVEQAIKPAKGSAEKLGRATVYLANRFDTQATNMLDDIMPLDKAERQVVSNLEVLADELKRNGQDVGTLMRWIDDYQPRRYHTSADIYGTRVPTEDELRGSVGGQGAADFQKGRAQYEMASIVPEARLAEIVRKLAKKPVSAEEARDIAQRWYDSGKIRFTTGQLAREVQRGVRPIAANDMADVEQQAMHWSNYQEAPGGARLFLDPAKTEGLLKLAPEREIKEFGLTENPYDAMPAADADIARLHDALTDQHELEQRINLLDEPEGPLGLDWQAMLARRQDEINELQQRINVMPLSGKEREALESWSPNASSDTRETLADFRSKNPNLAPILNPRDTYFYRATAQARTTAYRARHEAIDQTVGRSVDESQASLRVSEQSVAEYLEAGDTAVPTEGTADQLKPVYSPDNPMRPVGYQVRGTEIVFDPSEIDFTERTLVPNKTALENPYDPHAIYFDPHTGREYQPAPNFAEVTADAHHAKFNVAQTIRSEVGHGRLWPTDVMRDFNAEMMRMGEYEDGITAGVAAGFQHVMENLRYGVTTMFPAFQTRNMISDALMSLQSDSGVLFHPIANAKVAWAAMARDSRLAPGTIRVPGWGVMPTEDVLLLMDLFGARSNVQVADLMLRAERGVESPTVRSSFLRQPGRRTSEAVGRGFGFGRKGAVGRRAQEFSSRREDIMRMATLLQRLRRNGGDMADAAWHMISVHFDYGDLTLFERRSVRNLFLFYTWYRKNLPRQLMQLIHRPGFFNAINYTVTDTANGQAPWNQNWSAISPWLPDMSGKLPNPGLIPDYLWNGAPIATSWNNHAFVMGFGAPWADLHILDNLVTNPLGGGLRGLAELGNPLATTLFQAAMHQDLLTGRRFQAQESSGLATFVDWFERKFGLGSLPKDDEGKPLLPWIANLIDSSLPIAGRGSSYLDSSVPAEQDQGRARTELGGPLGRFLTGFNVYVGPQKARPKTNERTDMAYIKLVLIRGYERTQFIEDLGRRQGKAGEKWRQGQIDRYDRQTAEWLKDNKIPAIYAHMVPGLGDKFYKGEDEKASNVLQSVGLDSLGSSPDDFGPSKGGNKPEPYLSPQQKAYDKLHGKGDSDDKGTLSPVSLGLNMDLGSISSDWQPNAEQVAAAGRIFNSNVRADKRTPSPRGKAARISAQRKPVQPLDLKGVLQAVEGLFGDEEPGAKSKRQQAKTLVKRIHKLRAKAGGQLEGPLTAGQKVFGARLARKTGLSPRVIGGWMLAEESSSAAAQRQAEGNHNWLNIGYYDSGPGGLTQDSVWSTPTGAADATAAFLKGEKFGASPGIRAILSAVGQSDAAQTGAIANSGWASSGYGGGASLRNAAAQVTVTPTNKTAARQLHKLERHARELGIDPDPSPPDWLLEGGPKHVRSAIKIIGKHQIDQWLKPAGGNTGNPRNIYNLNPVLARQLIKLAKASGEPITITSGYRTKEDQANISPGTNPAAPAGLSAHQFGMAADADMTAKQAELAPQFGLEHGMAGPGVADPPHTELTSPKLIKQAMEYGPIRSGYAPAGIRMSVGDLGNWKVQAATAVATGYAGAATMASSGSSAPTPTGIGLLNRQTLDPLDSLSVDAQGRLTPVGLLRSDDELKHELRQADRESLPSHGSASLLTPTQAFDLGPSDDVEEDADNEDKRHRLLTLSYPN